MKTRVLAVLALALAALLAAPSLALGVVPQPTLAVQNAQLWVLLIGSVAPLAAYLLNHYAPWVSEPVKAAVQVVLAAVASTIYSAIATKTFGWNTATVELVASGVLSALIAHKIIWLPAGISALLGGGTNAPATRTRARTRTKA